MPHIVGWALVNSCICTPLYEQAQQVVGQQRQVGVLPETARVAVGLMICLVKEWQGQGLMRALTAMLYQQLETRYDVIYATVHTLNQRSMRFFHREGYRAVEVSAERVSFLRPITSPIKLPPVPAELILRKGLPSDAAALHALNLQWTRAARHNDLTNGFLTTVYSELEFCTILAAEEVVVLECLPTVYSFWPVGDCDE